MKATTILFLSIFAFSILNCKKRENQTTKTDTTALSNQEYYQLKIYTFENEDQEKVTDTYLKNA